MMKFWERLNYTRYAVRIVAIELKSWKTLFCFFFPPALYGIFIIGTLFTLPQNLNWELITLTFLYLVTPTGKEIVVPAAVFLLKSYFGVWSIVISAFTIAFVDFFAGLWMMWNWYLIKLIPSLGKYVEKLERIGEKKWRKHRHLSKLAYLGLALSVAYPFQGLGALGATVVGRILGMEPHKVLYSITFGSLFGCSLTAIASYFAMLSFKHMEKPILNNLEIIIFIVVFIIAYIWLRNNKK